MNQEIPAMAETRNPLPWGSIVMTVCVMTINATLMVMLLTHAYPPESKDIILLAVGQAMGWGGAAVSYWLGSSAGSAAKDARLAALQPKATDDAPSAR